MRRKPFGHMLHENLYFLADAGFESGRIGFLTKNCSGLMGSICPETGFSVLLIVEKRVGDHSVSPYSVKVKLSKNGRKRVGDHSVSPYSVKVKCS